MTIGRNKGLIQRKAMLSGVVEVRAGESMVDITGHFNLAGVEHLNELAKANPHRRIEQHNGRLYIMDLSGGDYLKVPERWRSIGFPGRPNRPGQPPRRYTPLNTLGKPGGSWCVFDAQCDSGNCSDNACTYPDIPGSTLDPGTGTNTGGTIPFAKEQDACFAKGQAYDFATNKCFGGADAACPPGESFDLTLSQYGAPIGCVPSGTVKVAISPTSVCPAGQVFSVIGGGCVDDIVGSSCGNGSSLGTDKLCHCAPGMGWKNVWNGNQKDKSNYDCVACANGVDPVTETCKGVPATPIPPPPPPPTPQPKPGCVSGKYDVSGNCLPVEKPQPQPLPQPLPAPVPPVDNTMRNVLIAAVAMAAIGGAVYVATKKKDDEPGPGEMGPGPGELGPGSYGG